MATDYSPYAGMRSQGRIVQVLRRGQVVVRQDAFTAERGSGSWLPLVAGAHEHHVAAAR